MKIFQELENHLVLLGILPWSSIPKARYITIALNCISFVILTSSIITCILFLLLEAQTTAEKTDGIFHLLTLLLEFAWYFNFIFNRKKYAAIIIELVKIIEKRK